jgi:predicted TIM-barrel fold metal-dependent hydrolase
MFFGEERQMLPPYMTDGINNAERFLSNMDYAQVSAAVITQEFIDGLQNDYLEVVQRQYPERFFCFGMADWRQTGYYHEAVELLRRGFKGLKVPAARLPKDFLGQPHFHHVLNEMEQRDAILGIELMDGDVQVAQMEEIIAAHPQLRIIIGHFGMVTRPNWMSQIKLARHENVYVESGGITWLFNDEFYPFPSAIKAIKEAADEVGWSKLMWGSDYPRTITAITYKMSYDFITKSKELTEEQKELFLFKNAQQFFGFGELKELPYIKNMSE